MTIAFYLMPMVGTGAPGDRFRIKHEQTSGVVRSGGIRYSRISVAVAMIEADAATQTSIQADAEVTLLADDTNIDNALTAGQASAAKTILEARGVPDSFVNAGDTRRQVLRAIIGLFLFSQRMEGLFGDGFWRRAQDSGVTLDTVWSAFPQVLKDAFTSVRNDFGWQGNLGLTNASTLREIMAVVSAQFEQTPMLIAGVEI